MPSDRFSIPTRRKPRKLPSGTRIGGTFINLSDARADESLLDFLSRKTRDHGSMCPCDYCRALKAI